MPTRHNWRVGTRSGTSGTLEPIVAKSARSVGVIRFMQVRDAMSKMVLTIGPGHTLRQAAQQMAKRNVGAAVVMDPDGAGPGIPPQREILHSVGRGQGGDAEAGGAPPSAGPV